MQLYIDAESPLDSGGRANVLNVVNHGRLPHIADIPIKGLDFCLHKFVGLELVPSSDNIILAEQQDGALLQLRDYSGVSEKDGLVPWVGMLGSSGPTVTNLFPPLILPMETAMRTGDTILAIAVLLGLLATVGWYAYAGLTGSGEPMPSDNYIA